MAAEYRKTVSGTPSGTKVSHLAWGFLFLLAVVWAVRQTSFPHYRLCDSCEGQGTLSCGAEDCVRGRVSCPGPCVKADSEGWQRLDQDVPGHSRMDLWMVFHNDDGTWTACSKAHAGEVYEKISGNWVNKGKCKICDGTTRMACPECKAALVCESCGGAGRLRNWLW